MKKITLAFLMLLSCKAYAAINTNPITNALAVKTIASVGTFCTKTTINTTPTEITSNTTVNTTSAMVYAVKVENQDTTNDLFCSHDSAVATSGAHQGDQIAHAAAAPWNSLSWGISPMEKWFCIAASSSISAMVCLTQ